MKPTKMLLGLGPWILFSVIAGWAGPSSVGIAAGVAGLCSLALTIHGARKQGIKIIDVAGVITFGVLTVIGLVCGHAVRQDLVDYGRGGSALVLALVMAISAFTFPFTAQYARANVDPRYWSSPVFNEINKKISLVWAGLIGVMAISHLTYGALAAHGSGRPVLNVVLNWGVPLLVIVRGLKITEQISSQGRISASTAV